MYDQVTSPNLLNATSSPELESGHTRFVPPAGQMIDLFGQVPVLANLSARQAKELRLLTSGTSGQPSTTSSKSADLNMFLVSRLQVKTRTLGSTLYKMTWKPWVTPSGRSRFRLRASVLRTSGTEPTGLLASPRATPAARDWKDTPGMVAQRDGKDRLDQLPRQAYLAGWPTTSCNNDRTGSEQSAMSMTRQDGSKVQQRLQDFAVLTGWPTARANDAEKRGQVADDPRNGLVTAANLSGWTTPTATERSGKGERNRALCLDASQANWSLSTWTVESGPARLTATGKILTGCSAGMESGGQLRAGHSRWLMGIPLVWEACAPTETLLTLSKRESSLKP